MSMARQEKDLLEARLGDAIEKRERGETAYLSFLTPRERKRAERLLREWGAYHAAFFFGGYSEAERVCLFLLPEYLTDCLPAPVAECEAETVKELLGESLSEAVSALRISGSGFHKHTHRDFLGSVLGLGIERDALGDIAVQNEFEAVLFCPQALLPFFMTHLERVGNDAVKVREYQPDASFTDGKSYQRITDTVASARLDCVVAALCNLSREAAQAAIRSGTVEVEFEICERPDLSLEPPVTLSVRGFGRFILRSFDGETRKGRLRLSADRLI